MHTITYPRASKYADLHTVYAQCGGPGGLKLAEFMAEKMQLQSNRRLLDVGTSRGGISHVFWPKNTASLSSASIRGLTVTAE
jgi:hypothetical protein